MANEPLEVTQRIVPSLQYEDVGATVEFLTKAFGFDEKPEERMTADDRRVWHAALDFEGTSIMLGTVPGYQSPKRQGHIHQALYVYVDDVDAHYARARAAGAEIVDEPTNQFYGDRNYTAEDPEGHHWYFAQKIRDVAPGGYAPSDADVKRHLG